MPMLLDREYKIPSKYNSKISLKVVPGHFATSQSHINFYMDMTTLKVRHCDAAEVAKEMAKEYQYSTPVDTIVCMDGCEIIGSCLAEELTRNGIMSLNRHNSMYIITPELDKNGQTGTDDLAAYGPGQKHPAFAGLCHHRQDHRQKP